MKTRDKGRAKARDGESGFALLLVFVMAAAISITLYMEVPRIAFESQRTKEQMAIDRGLQYERAIQLFYRKFHLYPQTLDDLETTRNVRFLRHRYKDPLTGKDFRLLHVGPAGQLTDSLVQPPAPLPGSSTGNGPNSTQGSSTSASSQTSGSSQTASSNSAPAGDPNNPANPNDPNAQSPPDPLNMALRRPSDRIIGAGGGAAGGTGVGVAGGANGVFVGDPGQQPPPSEPDPNQPQQPLPGQPVQQPADPNQPAQPGQPQDPSQPTFPGQPPVSGQAPQDPSQAPQPPAVPIQFSPGLSSSAANPGQTPGTPNSLQQPSGFQAAPGQAQQYGQLPGQPTPGGAAGQTQSAASLIQNILTTPRQPPSSISGFTSGNTGGIAGVASTADGKGIHVVNDHAKYKEWEFIYDLKKDKTVMGAAAVNAQQNVQQQMQQNQNGTNNSFGSSSAFGSSTSGSSTGSGNGATGPSPFSSGSTNSGSSAPSAPPPSQ
jgi:hypothetical protein